MARCTRVVAERSVALAAWRDGKNTRKPRWRAVCRDKSRLVKLRRSDDRSSAGGAGAFLQARGQPEVERYARHGRPNGITRIGNWAAFVLSAIPDSKRAARIAALLASISYWFKMIKRSFGLRTIGHYHDTCYASSESLRC